MLTAAEVRALTVWKWKYNLGPHLSHQEVARLLFVRYLLRQGRLSE